MGLVNQWVRDSVGNATKCDTLSKMIDSKKGTLTILNLSHVGSSFVLLITGLMISMLAFIYEWKTKKIYRKTKTSYAGQEVASQPRTITGYYKRSKAVQY